MTIFLFVIIAFTYTYYLYRSDFRFISLFWVLTFSISFLLPVLINKPFKYGFLLDANSYQTLNRYYLLALICFVIPNLILNLYKPNFNDEKLEILTINNTSRVFEIYAVLTIFVILLTGFQVINTGTVGSLEHHPLMKIFSASILFGLLYTSLIRIYISDNKKIYYFIISLIVIFIVSVLVFGRRILIYPIIAVVILTIFKRRKAPNILFVSLVGIFIITIILPMMMSIRTFGMKSGVANFYEMLTGDFNNYLNYLSYGTDVNYSYSFAAVILSTDTKVSILTFFKPIFSLIPRNIWPDKPQPLSEALIQQLQLPFDKGMSIPPGFIGESYAYLGIAGVIIASALFGLLCGLVDLYCLKLRQTSEGLVSVKLAVIIIIAIQIVMGSIRGDTATNIQEAFYLFVPLSVFIKFSQYKYKI